MMCVQFHNCQTQLCKSRFSYIFQQTPHTIAETFALAVFHLKTQQLVYYTGGALCLVTGGTPMGLVADFREQS